MANYLEMNREELTAEKAKLNEQYKKFLAMNLKLNMARGKPGPHQMDLAMGLLQMNDYTTDAGTDARNYGDLEGLHEARVLFADVFGVKPEEVFVGGNSSLQLMYNLINIGYVFGFPESPCPWSQVEKRKFLCPVPGYDRHFAITEEFGFELISDSSFLTLNMFNVRTFNFSSDVFVSCFSKKIDKVPSFTLSSSF